MDQWRRKSLREEKSGSGTKSPSFSSTLLDAIYRSFDESDHQLRETEEDQSVILHRETMKKKQSSISSSKNNFIIRAGSNTTVMNDEVKEIAMSQRRACLIDKWMEKKVSTEKAVNNVRRKSVPVHVPDNFDRKVLNNDHRSSSSMLFHSTSSSSDSSSGGGFSSSEAESVHGSRTRSSSVPLQRPKPVRTSVSVRPERYMNHEIHQNDRNHQPKAKNENGIFRTKSKAKKIYGDLMKVKQPISPGGKIASFINSLFTPKKSSKISTSVGGRGVHEDFVRSERKSKSAQTSTCSSASSFSRSCLSKAPSSNNGKLSNGIKRSVRFYPVSVIVDEDSRPCGQKSLHQDEPNLMSLNEELNFHLKEKNQQRSVEEVALDLYASSDLFELDNLSSIGIDRYREELPVYETTHFETNRAIAKGFIL
ncbi:hypothetical protein BVC80_209g105 [Macleaya cordata]|uniref:Protein BIG GRAIN 1-like B n=1 Tax=Macleaya cordata TaxID=56857 RepID=A0A200QD25_MACCD|nr:hypothetical protein BVC80_209g105 [Macleaya cordata]